MNTISNSSMLVQYIRKDSNDNSKGEPIGALVAGLINDRIRIGWSLVKRSSGDVFNRQRGLEIAVGRADMGSNEPVPNSIAKNYIEMENRAKRYFQGKYFESECVLPEGLRVELMTKVE